MCYWILVCAVTIDYIIHLVAFSFSGRKKSTSHIKFMAETGKLTTQLQCHAVCFHAYTVTMVGWIGAAWAKYRKLVLRFDLMNFRTISNDRNGTIWICDGIRANMAVSKTCEYHHIDCGSQVFESCSLSLSLCGPFLNDMSTKLILILFHFKPSIVLARSLDPSPDVLMYNR